MIGVDNSAKNRVFYLKKYSKKESFKELKIEIIKSIENKNYLQLENLKNKKYANQFSIYIFYEKILNAIPKVKNQTIRNQLEKLDWLKVLVGDINEIREIIKENYYILASLKPQVKDFEQYKGIFEDLYKTQLSSKENLKKEFFRLFKDINVCPYCNRNFINPIYKKEKVHQDNMNQSPDIEHFFPKSIYPFLSLSISNLLPSCAFCNKIKSDVDTYTYNCLSPYEIDRNDIFKFEFDSIETDKREVRLITNGDEDIYNSKVLHLDSLYNEIHSKYVNDIFKHVIKYPKKHREFLDKFFDLPIDMQERQYKKKFCNYYKEEDFNKHPLSKMTKDLFTHVKNYRDEDN